MKTKEHAPNQPDLFDVETFASKGVTVTPGTIMTATATYDPKLLGENVGKIIGWIEAPEIRRGFFLPIYSS